MTPQLTTNRLSLRRADHSDQTFCSDLIGHSLVRRYLGGSIPPEERTTTLSRYFDVGPGEHTWLVEKKATAQAIGLAFLSHHKDGEHLELSYQFHPEAWGNGFATEAMRRLRDHALNDLSCRRLIAETQVANVASCRLLERLGMTELRRVRRFGLQQAIYTT